MAHCKPMKSGVALIIGGIGWIMLIAECVIYTDYTGHMYDGVNASFPTIGALLLAAGLYEYVRNLKIERTNSMVSVLSQEALPIYLMHVVWIKLLGLVFGEYILGTALLCTALVCAVCIVLGKVIKSIPIICCLVRM